MWRARPLVASAAGAAGAAHLDSLRQVAAAPVVAERDLQYASQLLRDPAYHQVGIQRKVHQLSKLVVAALIREERGVVKSPCERCRPITGIVSGDKRACHAHGSEL